MCRAFAEKSSITGNKVGKICVKRPNLRPGSMSSYIERDLIRERTNAGLAAARARGRVGGRPRKLSTNGKVALAQRLFADKKHAIDDICSTLGISRSTFYRYVREAAPPASDS